MKKISIFFILIFSCLQSQLIAEDNLRDLSPVCVEVLGISDKHFRKKIKTKVELTLRKAGIKVVDENQGAKVFLALKIQTMPIDRKDKTIMGYVYCMHSTAATYALLEHSKKLTLADIWQTNQSIGTTPPNELYSILSKNVDEHADEFTNAYLKANNK